MSRLLTMNFIGTGKLGKTLAYLIHKKGLGRIVGICNKSIESSANAAAVIGTGSAYSHIANLPLANVIFITTPDDQIETIAKELIHSQALQDESIVLHCSGLLSSECLSILKKKNVYTASIHPMKSFVDFNLNQSLEATYCAMEGDLEACNILRSLFEGLGASVYSINKASKPLYHLSGVLVSNFIVTLAHEACQFMVGADIEKPIAKKIIQELLCGTVKNIAQSLDIKSALTGPIQRGDIQTLSGHLAALNGDHKVLYQALSKATIAISEQSKAIKEKMKLLLL